MNDRPKEDDTMPTPKDFKPGKLSKAIKPGMRYNPQTREHEEDKSPIKAFIDGAHPPRTKSIIKEVIDAITRTRPPIPMPPEPRPGPTEQLPDVPGLEARQPINMVVFRDQLVVATATGVFVLEETIGGSAGSGRRRWVEIPFGEGE